MHQNFMNKRSAINRNGIRREQNKQATRRKRSKSDPDVLREMCREEKQRKRSQTEPDVLREQNHRYWQNRTLRELESRKGGVVPSDMYLKEFERNPCAAQAFFWMRTYNWEYSDFRHENFENLSKEKLDEVKADMTKQGTVSESDSVRMLEQYRAIVNPHCPAQCCASCGYLEIPVDSERLGNEH